MKLLNRTIFVCAALVFVPAGARAQEVYKDLSNQRLEDILRSMSIEYTKGELAKGAGTYYDYKSKNQNLRLYNYNGKDLMIDCFFNKVDWETINKWNSTAKFSRARLSKDPKQGEQACLESNLDVLGGVTDDTVKHFIRSFDMEIDAWFKTTVPSVTEEETFKNVTPAKLEKILDDLKITYKKTPAKGNTVYYDFKRNNYEIRLTNFNGEDLMIDCIWNMMADLSKLNQWNLKHYYVRAVQYNRDKGMPYVALEANLDCVGGTTDSIIRYFITAFDKEVQDFDGHLKGKK